MNRLGKMMLMRSAGRQDRHEDDQRDYDRPDMRSGYSVPEGRFRDRDGREHYNNGRFAPMSYGGQVADYPRSDYMEPYSHHPMVPYVPPVYEGGYREMTTFRPMNKIGFSVDGEMERLPRELGHDYRTSAGYAGMDEMSRRQGRGYDMGQYPRMMPVFNRQMAEEWAASMKNADKSPAPHWPMEKTNELMKQYGVSADPVEFWIVMNSLYSDYCEALRRSKAATEETYVYMAKAWIDDADAVPDKAAAYYTYIVKH